MTTDERAATPSELYAVGPEIGRGGMGRILAARDRKLHRDVVIKLLREPGHTARFEREALITARLQHPSIVRVYDAGRLRGEPFYAMEYVRGRSLDRVVADVADDERARLALVPHVIAIAEALAYAHSEGVIHRDLKPANVLVGSFGETVVIDWGLAKDTRAAATAASLDPDRRIPGPPDSAPPPLVSDSDLTAAGAVMGTPSYMPPEQARGEPADERSDVYAIGAILYTVLAGTPPISGEHALVDARAGGIQPLRDRAPGTPAELVTIVEHAMAFDPADRYASARELADDLRRFAAGQLVAHHTYTTGALVGRWLRRHRVPVAIAAAGLALVIALSVLAVRSLAAERDRAAEAAATSGAALAAAEERSDRLVFHQATRALGSDPSTALAWLAWLSPAARDLPRTRELADAAARRGVAFEIDGPATATAPLLATDATTAYSGSVDGHLVRWQLATWRATALPAHRGAITALAASADGIWLASGGADHAVQLWNLFQATETPRPKSGHSATVRALAFSPDGATLASTGDDGALILWTVATGAPRIAYTAGQPLGALGWSADGGRLWIRTADGHVLEHVVAAATTREAAPRPAEPRASPDGAWRAVAAGPRVQLASLATRAAPRELAGHRAPIADLAFTPDSARLLSLAGDGTLRIWPLAPAPAAPGGAALARWLEERTNVTTAPR